MESCWNFVSYAHIIVQMMVMGYVLYRFAEPFMQESRYSRAGHLSSRKPASLMTGARVHKKGAVCTGIAYFATMLFLYFVPLEINNFTAYGIGMAAAFLVMYRTDCRNFRQKIFIAVTFFALRWLSVYMVGIITEELYQRIISAVYMTGHPYVQFAAYIVVEILDVAAEAAVAGLGAGYIVKAYIYKNENMSLKEMFMLIVPSITGMTGYGIMQYYQAYLEINVREAISGVYHILAFLHFGISIVTIVVMTVLFQNIKARQEEKLQNELLSAEIDSTEKHIAQVESLYQNIRSIKHDMTNHILTLEGLYAGEQREEAQAYGVELKNILSEMTGEIKSGNPVTDVILQEQKKEAAEKNIDFRTDFYYPKGSRINAFDISVILNNALQNAMENANADAPYIFVHSYHRDNAYMIEICNSFTGDLQWDTENELPVTTKRKADGHGYGLINIRRVAEKYSGDIAIDIKDGEFRISIMLMMDGE